MRLWDFALKAVQWCRFFVKEGRMWQTRNAKGFSVLLSLSPPMSWQRAAGLHCCCASSGVEIRNKSMNQHSNLQQTTQASLEVPRHWLLCEWALVLHHLPPFTGTGIGEGNALVNLQCCTLFRDVDLCFDLQVFLYLWVTGLLEIAHI